MNLTTCTTFVPAMASIWACHCGNISRASVSVPLFLLCFTVRILGFLRAVIRATVMLPHSRAGPLFPFSVTRCYCLLWTNNWRWWWRCGVAAEQGRAVRGVSLLSVSTSVLWRGNSRDNYCRTKLQFSVSFSVQKSYRIISFSINCLQLTSMFGFNCTVW